MLPDHASGASFQFISARKIERAQAGDLTLLGGSRTSAVALNWLGCAIHSTGLGCVNIQL